MTLAMVARRLGMGALTVFGVSVLIFLLLSVLPGDPLAGLLPENAQPKDRQALAEQLGLDRPLPVRYVSWVGDLARGDLGYSPFRRRSVADLIAAEGYDPAFGARPLKRAIQRLVQNPLAVKLLEGEFTDGDTIIAAVQPGSNRITFHRVEEAAAVA